MRATREGQLSGGFAWAASQRQLQGIVFRSIADQQWRWPWPLNVLGSSLSGEGWGINTDTSFKIRVVIKYTCCEIYHFNLLKVDSSAASALFKLLCNCHHCPTSEHFCSETWYPFSNDCPFPPPPVPGNYRPIFCLHKFAYFKYLR